MKYGLFSENVAAFVALLAASTFLLFMPLLRWNLLFQYFSHFTQMASPIPLYWCSWLLTVPSSFFFFYFPIPYIKLEERESNGGLGPIGSRLYCWRGTFSIGIPFPCQDPKLALSSTAPWYIYITYRSFGHFWSTKLALLFIPPPPRKNSPKVSSSKADAEYDSPLLLIVPSIVRHQTGV